MYPWGLHGGHHRGIPSLDRGGFSPTISPSNPTHSQVMGYGHLLNGGLGGYYRGNLPRVTWAAGYSPKILDTIGSIK
jgi:hypothetical protein